jgi:hypothetical protein
VRVCHFGDSYDIVKQSLLGWLKPAGPWVAHPMFSERFSPQQCHAFTVFLGVPLLTDAILKARTDRTAYFAAALACNRHLFLDPDIGLRREPARGAKAARYLFEPELIEIAKERPKLLTLVFDQSLARGREQEELRNKLERLAHEGVHAGAYVSHACFILLSCDSQVLKEALGMVRAGSSLPEERFLELRTA